jgi:hypothetical protein
MNVMHAPAMQLVNKIEESGVDVSVMASPLKRVESCNISNMLLKPMSELPE